jgi:dTMP kinase
MGGRFITFEGGEGAGKSTQIDRLRGRLEALGRRVRVTREPGGSEKAERIRTILLGGRAKALGPQAEALLFYAARLDHLERVIRPALAEGIHVLCDRFADSTRAYQGALGHVGASALRALDRVVVDGTQPDLTLILDLPAAEGLARARRRGGGPDGPDRFEAEDLSFHERLREAFLAIAREDPARCAVVDAAPDPKDVEQAIWAVVRTRLPDLARAEAAAHVA